MRRRGVREEQVDGAEREREETKDSARNARHEGQRHDVPDIGEGEIREGYRGSNAHARVEDAQPSALEQAAMAGEGEVLEVTGIAVKAL